MLRRLLGAAHPLVFGHRGASGLAPENTLPSFALALSMGADVLELDVHCTSDGVIVVHHDDTLDRTTDGTGLIREHTFAELQTLDAGCRFTRDGRDFPYRGHGVWIPTLEEVLDAFPDVAINMEIKQGEPPIVDAVLHVLREMEAEERVLLAAEHDPIMAEIRRLAGDIPTSFATAEAIEFFDRFTRKDFAGYAPLGTALQIPARFGETELVTAESVAIAHEHGLEVHVWTINDRDEMDALLALGIDGIMSDLPGLARMAVDSGAGHHDGCC
jgi:glycerophosphoryl diester phosphodiesterase